MALMTCHRWHRCIKTASDKRLNLPLFCTISESVWCYFRFFFLLPFPSLLHSYLRGLFCLLPILFSLMLLTAGFLLSSKVAMASSYNATGWQWYSKANEVEDIAIIDPFEAQDDAKIEKDKQSEKVEKAEKATSLPQAVSYKAQLQAFQAHYEEMQAKAVMTRKVEDVAYVMYLRMFMMEQSKDYGRAFQQALLQYPNLSHELKFPIQDRARQLSREREKQRQTQAIQQYAQTHGLFFFYKGQDVYSQSLASSIQSFADQYGITLMGIAVDGVMVNDIKDNMPSDDAQQQGIAKKLTHWGVKAVPALFLYDNQTKQVRPFAYGFIAQDQMAERFLQFATDYAQKPLRGDVSHEIR
ncbi:conjugal transfer protein TraF [Cysteiniphilum halobium]|uniref:conjugal transfer protein TraF n=1 Tax=Cysteiniphilum halobium TaxID=2219059 RepID=UPI003F863D0D